MPSLRGSPETESRKKSLTDEYTLDANGVTAYTVKRFMEYLDLPEDKLEAEEKFRTLLERTGTKPSSVILKEARTMLDSKLL